MVSLSARKKEEKETGRFVNRIIITEKTISANHLKIAMRTHATKNPIDKTLKILW